MFKIGKKDPQKSTLQQAKENIERVEMKPELKEKMAEDQLDLLRRFAQVFENPNGQEVLNHLDLYSHKNFPNYENVNATYSKIGEQTLVAYIKSLLYKAKKGGE